jgi:hypothetical protein
MTHEILTVRFAQALQPVDSKYFSLQMIERLRRPCHNFLE